MSGLRLRCDALSARKAAQRKYAGRIPTGRAAARHRWGAARGRAGSAEASRALGVGRRGELHKGRLLLRAGQVPEVAKKVGVERGRTAVHAAAYPTENHDGAVRRERQLAVPKERILRGTRCGPDRGVAAAILRGGTILRAGRRRSVGEHNGASDLPQTVDALPAHRAAGKGRMQKDHRRRDPRQHEQPRAQLAGKDHAGLLRGGQANREAAACRRHRTKGAGGAGAGAARRRDAGGGADDLRPDRRQKRAEALRCGAPRGRRKRARTGAVSGKAPAQGCETVA